MTEITQKNNGSSTDMQKEQNINFSDAQITNKKVKDNGAKLIFGNPILCAQFLRGYTNIELLKDVQPEDITDISERFISMWHEERDSDSIKEADRRDSERGPGSVSSCSAENDLQSFGRRTDQMNNFRR